MRQCVLEKRLENCAYCGEYPCEKLDKAFDRSPEAQATLEGTRKRSLSVAGREGPLMSHVPDGLSCRVNARVFGKGSMLKKGGDHGLGKIFSIRRLWTTNGLGRSEGGDR